MPSSFIGQRERSNEELKLKGRIEKERQWGSKVKGSSVLQNISKGMPCLRKGCVHLSHSQVDRDLSVLQLNKGTLVYSQVEGQSPPGKPVSMIMITKAMKSKSKKQFPTWRQSWFPPYNSKRHKRFLGQEDPLEEGMTPHILAISIS